MNVIEYLISNLERIGVSDFFGVPGDYNFNVLYEIENNPDTRWIGCTNELNAGYAADGYARQKGFGAVVTTYGVGELSVINAIAGSYAENVPVINIVGTPSTKTLAQNIPFHHSFQESESQRFIKAFESVTAAAAFLNKDNAKIEIDRLLKIFVKERKPIYIAVPEDIALMKISDKETDYDWVSNPNTLEKVVNAIVKRIDCAQRPVILADTLIKKFDAKYEFIDFVEKSGIPVTNFLMGMNIVNMDYKNYLGTYLSEYGNLQVKDAINKTDCLISVGTIYGDTNSYGKSIPFDINSHIAIYGTYTYVDGEKYENVKMSDILRKITHKINTKGYKFEKSDLGYKPSISSKNDLSSNYFYSRLQEYFKGEDIIYAEVGTITQGIAPMKFPENCDVQTQLLWCSIGWVLPAAFGAGIANPKARIIILTGDGAHQVSAMEVGNMCRYGLKPIIIVLNNNGYTIERKLSGDENSDFNNIMAMDYAKFARSFKGDIWSTKVTTDDDFDKALRVTQIMDKVCYVDAVTDKLDLTEFAKNVLIDIKKNQVSGNVQKTQKKEKKSDIHKTENYETSVHMSIKEIEA